MSLAGAEAARNTRSVMNLKTIKRQLNPVLSTVALREALNELSSAQANSVNHLKIGKVLFSNKLNITSCALAHNVKRSVQ